MTVTVVTQYTYPITDTLNSKVNTAILKQELDDAGLSVSVGSVSVSGSSIFIELLGDAAAADIVLVDAVIAAHAGDDFVSVPIKVSEIAESPDDGGSEVIRVTLTTGALAAGEYLLSWLMEHCITTNTGTTGSRASLYYSKNGDTPAQFTQEMNINDQWSCFSGGYPITVQDGDSWVFTLRHQRVGVAGNPSRVRRARLALMRAE